MQSLSSTVLADALLTIAVGCPKLPIGQSARMTTTWMCMQSKQRYKDQVILLARELGALQRQCMQVGIKRIASDTC